MVVVGAGSTVIRGESVTQGIRGNSVIVASDTPLDPAVFAELLEGAGDPGDVITDFDAYVDGATILTDDFAPVDQLINSGS